MAEGQIQRATRGVYCFPKLHDKLGKLHPTIDEIARTVAKRDHMRLLASGAYAANLLGLSEQVPARVVFLTDGESRKLSVGRAVIELKKVAPRFMALAGTESGLVIEALRHFGQRRVTQEMISRLKQVLSPRTKRELAKHLKLAPAWIRTLLLEVVEAENNG